MITASITSSRGREPRPSRARSRRAWASPTAKTGRRVSREISRPDFRRPGRAIRHSPRRLVRYFGITRSHDASSQAASLRPPVRARTRGRAPPLYGLSASHRVRRERGGDAIPRPSVRGALSCPGHDGSGGHGSRVPGPPRRPPRGARTTRRRPPKRSRRESGGPSRAGPTWPRSPVSASAPPAGRVGVRPPSAPSGRRNPPRILQPGSIRGGAHRREGPRGRSRNPQSD